AASLAKSLPCTSLEKVREASSPLWSRYLTTTSPLAGSASGVASASGFGPGVPASTGAEGAAAFAAAFSAYLAAFAAAFSSAVFAIELQLLIMLCRHDSGATNFVTPTG